MRSRRVMSMQSVQSVMHRVVPRLLVIAGLLLGALPAQAVDYVFPGTLPVGCVDNANGSYNCPALTLGAADTFTIAAPKPATITFSGALSTGASVALNSGGPASDLTLVINGAFTLGATSRLNASVQTLGAGAVTIGSGSTVAGSISTQTGFVDAGASSVIGGSITTVTGYVGLGAGTIVSGAVSTLDAGYVVLGASAQIGGAVTVAGAGYITLGDAAKVGGSISTVSDAITLGANSMVGGSATVSDTGAVTLGANSQVGSNISTVTGATTVGANGIVAGQISMSGTGAITLGAGAKVYAVCCYAKDVSCVTDGSGLTPAPLMCVSLSATNFDCLETGATYNNVAGNPGLRNALFTKLVGTAFTFDIAAMKADGTLATSYASGAGKAITLELVDGSGTTACANRTAVVPAMSQTLTFAASNAGRKTATVNLGRAYANLRCRVTDATQSPSIVGCSGDNFSVRPPAPLLLADPASSSPSAKALPVIAAGIHFNLGVTAESGYGGTLTLDTSKLSAQLPAQDATVQGGGVVGVLTPSTLVANAAFAPASYTEVGYLYLAPGAWRDDLLTLVDSANGDCVSSNSNDQYLSDSLINGKYGCSVGNRTTATLGRFVPDHFEVSLPNGSAACAVKTAFTYFGQDGFTTAFTLTAKNAAGAPTQNYAGVFAKLDVSSYANYGFTASALPAGSTLVGSATVPRGTWGQGVARVSAQHQISRPSAPAPETLIAVNAAPFDDDVIASPSGTVGSGIRLRYGRLQMENAYGSELLPLSVPLEAQYRAAGGYYVTNTDDSCTVIPAASIVMGNYQQQLAACQTRLSPTGGIALQSGKLPGAGLVLSRPGAGHAGSVDLQLNVTTVASGNTCVGPTLSLATAAQIPWFGNNPAARATFGIYKSRLIYGRENY